MCKLYTFDTGSGLPLLINLSVLPIITTVDLRKVNLLREHVIDAQYIRIAFQVKTASFNHLLKRFFFSYFLAVMFLNFIFVFTI